MIACELFMNCIPFTVLYTDAFVTAAGASQVKQIATDGGLKVQRKGDKADMIDQVMKLHSKQHT